MNVHIPGLDEQNYLEGRLSSPKIEIKGKGILWADEAKFMMQE